jgi:hypothetical protein
MNLQLHHVVSDITGVTGMTIIRAIVYQTKVAACDTQIEAILKRLKKNAAPPASKLLPPRQRKTSRTHPPSTRARHSMRSSGSTSPRSTVLDHTSR